MNLRDVAAVSGKSGLFKVIKPTRNGVILETIDTAKARIVANANSKVSILNEISIYTTTSEGTVLLENVFAKIWEKYNTEIPVSGKSAEHELRSFILEIIPEYDGDRVYFSDLKKIATWYGILALNLPEIFTEVAEEKTDENNETVAATTAQVETPAPAKKTATKKSAVDTGAVKAKPAKAPTIKKTSTVSKRGA